MKQLRKYMVIGLVLAALPLHGQAFFERSFLPGNESSGGRDLALAGVSDASLGTASAITRNPALVLGSTPGISLFVNVRSQQLKERRSYPVVDTFNDFLADNVYVSNTNFIADGSAGLVYTRNRWALAAEYAVSNAMDYDYKEEIRSSGYDYNRDPVAGYHVIEFHNQFGKMNFGGAVNVYKSWVVGAGFSLLSGSSLSDGFGVVVIKAEDRLAADDTTFFPQEYSMNSAMDLHFGFSGNMTRRLKLNAGVTLPGAIEQDNVTLLTLQDTSLLMPNYSVLSDTSTSATIQRPSVVSFGLRFTPENMLRTDVYAQVDWVNWGAYSIDYTNSNLVDFDPAYSAKTIIRGGVEHLFQTGIPFRVGLTYINHPASASLNEAIISFGSGYQSEKISLDAGIAFSENSYRFNDLFPVTGEIREAKDTVYQNKILANISLIYHW